MYKKYIISNIYYLYGIVYSTWNRALQKIHLKYIAFCTNCVIELWLQLEVVVVVYCRGCSSSNSCSRQTDTFISSRFTWLSFFFQMLSQMSLSLSFATPAQCGHTDSIHICCVPIRGLHTQGPALCSLTKGVYFGAPCRPQVLLNGMVYPSEHFLVASPDVPASTCTSLFMQLRSVKVTRRVKFACQICLSFRNS